MVKINNRVMTFWNLFTCMWWPSYRGLHVVIDVVLLACVAAVSYRIQMRRMGVAKISMLSVWLFW